MTESGSGPGQDPRWSRLQDLFDQALAFPAAERAEFIARAAASDAGLRAELESLLAAHRSAGDFLEQPAASSSPTVSVTTFHASGAERLVGTDVGPYRILSLLGRGGMGVVYLGDDPGLGRRVAIKAVAPEHVHDPGRRDRLRREARAAAALTHPRIAAVYALEEQDDRVFIIGEYVAGPTLRDELSAGPLALDAVLATATDLADGLAAAHERGIVHRDLKPENVIRATDGRVKILDFGLARFRADGETPHITEPDRVLGTPAYMAPEQIRRDPVDARADVFAAGVVMFELLTARHPFASEDSASTMARILQDDPQGWPSGTQVLQTGLTAIIRRCLEKNPARRFASGRELMRALDAVRAGERPMVETTVDSARARRWWVIHQWLTSAAYAGLLVPLWIARVPMGKPGSAVFLLGAGSAVAALVLRLHRLFAASSLPAEWAGQRASTGPWLRAADLAFVATLAAAAVLLPEQRGEMAALLTGAAVSILLGSLVIEPATTRAAFDR
jgi:serine/threonine protein kinase